MNAATQRKTRRRERARDQLEPSGVLLYDPEEGEPWEPTRAGLGWIEKSAEEEGISTQEALERHWMIDRSNVARWLDSLLVERMRASEEGRVHCCSGDHFDMLFLAERGARTRDALPEFWRLWMLCSPTG